MNNIHNEDYIEIITRLRLARISAGITQKELSEKLNINQSIISKVENCERKIDVLEFFIWTNQLNISWKSIIPNKYLKLGDDNCESGINE
ncbi:helix-turn-helix transcriptional regulator [Pseudalkalibacillus sp. SCS-8]|uniref:helix-turn-helix domain-containing protein n=1 Tax=Pseudalkalibacillus nanhaiensis TaxID=3115291 RepID=UPI0032DB8366